tara:strand:- start:1913 stop:2398 length:486 start_codon:yes stop_codon:yes gene_type:complete
MIMTYPLKSKRKRFDPVAYKQSDNKAKKCITKYLTSIGHTVLDTEENFGVDLTSTLENIVYNHEVEMKHMWEGDWPTVWKDINIPFRKNRLIVQVFDNDPLANFYFYIIRGDCEVAWKMDATIVKDSPVVEVPNRAVREGEYFFKVPVDKAELIWLEEPHE